MLELEEALCLFSYTEIQLVAYAVLKGGSCVIHIRTHKNKHFNWFVVDFERGGDKQPAGIKVLTIKDLPLQLWTLKH